MREDMGAGAGWLCQERVRQEMGSGRCAGGWVGVVVATRGETLGAVVEIVKGVAGGGHPLSRDGGHPLGGSGDNPRIWGWCGILGRDYPWSCGRCG